MHPIVVSSAVFSYGTGRHGDSEASVHGGFLWGFVGRPTVAPVHAQTAMEKLQADFANPPAGQSP